MLVCVCQVYAQEVVLANHTHCITCNIGMVSCVSFLLSKSYKCLDINNSWFSPKWHKTVISVHFCMLR